MRTGMAAGDVMENWTNWIEQSGAVEEQVREQG